jgi:hypothetical protein
MEFLCTVVITIMMKRNGTLKEFSHFCYLKELQSCSFSVNVNSKFKKARRELEGYDYRLIVDCIMEEFWDY